MEEITESKYNHFKTLVKYFLVNVDNGRTGMDGYTREELMKNIEVSKRELKDWYKDITGNPIKPIPHESGKIFYKLEKFLLELITNIDGNGLDWHVGDMDIDNHITENSYELALRELGLKYNDLSPVASKKKKKSKKKKSKKNKSKKRKSKKNKSKKRKSKKKKSKKRKSKNK
tara:strand:+ start:936 stop:1454 length:519 start_codon:yes stop_codon:yes gene_type:complete